MDTGAWSNSTPFRLDEDDELGGEVLPVEIPISGTLSPVHTSTAQEISGTISGGTDPPVRSVADTSVPVSGLGPSAALSTIDEPVWDTVKRDLARVYYNIKVVLLPGYAQAAGNTKALKDWDLWGPLMFTLILAITLSHGNPKAGSIFSVVVLVICLGAVVLTLNVILLGGKIQFFQAVSLLGYCLFPLDVVAVISLFVSNWIARFIMLGIALGWCFWAAIPFVGSTVSERRRALAVYPILLLYTSVSWLTLTRG